MAISGTVDGYLMSVVTTTIDRYQPRKSTESGSATPCGWATPMRSSCGWTLSCSSV